MSGLKRKHKRRIAVALIIAQLFTWLNMSIVVRGAEMQKENQPSAQTEAAQREDSSIHESGASNLVDHDASKVETMGKLMINAGVVKTPQELQDAIDRAEPDSSGANPTKIYLANSMTLTQPIRLKKENTNIALEADSEITLAAATSRHFLIEDKATLSFNNIILDGMKSAGGIETREEITLRNAKIQNAYAAMGGGALWINDKGEIGDSIIDRCTFRNNRSSGAGGGAVYSNGIVNVYGSEIVNNETDSKFGGGGIYAQAGLRINPPDHAAARNEISTIISWNTAPEAAGIYSGGELEGTKISNADISGNTATAEIIGHRSPRGAGVLAMGDEVEITHAKITGNKFAKGVGNGANLFSEYGPSLIKAHISGGRGAENGGGAYILKGWALHIEDSRILDNVASRRGGGLFINDAYEFIIRRTEIAHNVAMDSATGLGIGGGVHLSRSEHSIAIYAEGRREALDEERAIVASKIAYNRADRGGGMSISQDYPVQLIDTRLEGNTAEKENGGGIYFALPDLCSDGESPMLMIKGNSVVRNNVAANDGGGIWVNPQKETVGSPNPATGDIEGIEKENPLLYLVSIGDEEGSARVVFERNKAAYLNPMKAEDAAEHAKNIRSISGNFSDGGNYAYNNLDIAYWSSNPRATSYQVSYDGNGHTEGEPPVDEKIYVENETVTVRGLGGGQTQTRGVAAVAMAKQGYTFTGWRTTDVGGLGEERVYQPDDTFQMPASNVKLTAVWKKNTTIPPELNRDDHYAYLLGYPNETIKPQNNITREETATIFFRLLSESSRSEHLSDRNSFTDVPTSAWSNRAISTMAAAGIVNGYKDRSFKPRSSITRAEFAVMAARFDDKVAGQGKTFTDIEGHWAKVDIQRAAELGWINGYSDGSFKPNQFITRAEVAALINRMLNRFVESKADLLEEMKHWSDNADVNRWYYLEMQEASNAHEYIRKSDGRYEVWTKLRENYPWADLEKPRHLTLISFQGVMRSNQPTDISTIHKHTSFAPFQTMIQPSGMQMKYSPELGWHEVFESAKIFGYGVIGAEITVETKLGVYKTTVGPFNPEKAEAEDTTALRAILPDMDSIGYWEISGEAFGDKADQIFTQAHLDTIFVTQREPGKLVSDAKQHTLYCVGKEPTINTPMVGDMHIAGKAKAGGKIEVKLFSGDFKAQYVAITMVDQDGNWRIELPEQFALQSAMAIEAKFCFSGESETHAMKIVPYE